MWNWAEATVVGLSRVSLGFRPLRALSFFEVSTETLPGGGPPLGKQMLTSVQINGSTFNVLYVATENDSVYALNADAPGSAPLWHRSFLGTGATIGTAWTGTSTAGNPSGITATPVIDSSKNRLYVIARTMESGNNVDRSPWSAQ